MATFLFKTSEPNSLLARIVNNNIVRILKMQLSEIKNMIEQQPLQPTIISYADSNHYLLGVKDDWGNFRCARSKNGKWLSFNSIKEAEKRLKQLGICYAIIQIQTAYDEMIGNSRPSHCQYRVNF